MKFKFGLKERAISTVLTTIIILVASVVLSLGVVLYATSLFQTSTQQEGISISGVKVWVNSDQTATGYAWGAFSVRNSGDKIVSVNKITIRGQDVPFTQWYPDTTVTPTILQQAMNFSGWANPSVWRLATDNTLCTPQTSDLEINLAINQNFCANATAGPVGLDPGAGAIIYFQLNNDTITAIDSGISTNIGIYSERTVTAISITVSGK